MLNSAKPVAFVAASDAGRARTFYRDTLGLKLVSEDSFALAFEMNGAALRVTLTTVVQTSNTALGWEVDDIAAAVRELARAGVRFERFPGREQDELGIWTAPGGARVAWFRDPDGNYLSVSQP